MSEQDDKLRALIEDGDKYYRAGNYGYAGVSYHEAKGISPEDPEVLARSGLALWKQSFERFVELMQSEGMREPEAGYYSLFSDAASEAAKVRSDALEKVTGNARFAASDEMLAISTYRLALVRARGFASLAAVDLLAGRSSSLSQSVEDALRDMEELFPGISQEAQERAQRNKSGTAKSGATAGSCQDAGGTKSGSGGCFVATAAYGSPIAQEVRVLRDFRDIVLARRGWGRTLIRVYERVGPVIAEMIGHRPFAKALVRHIVLKPAIALIRRLTGEER